MGRVAALRLLREAWLRIAGLDLRSLALMRMAIGGVLLADLAVRSLHFSMFYTDDGAVPLEFLFRHASTPGDLSLHAINGSPLFVGLMFLLHAAAALCLVVGYRSTLAGIACWLLTNSLHDRNFALLNGGDNWLRMILLWGIFLPWGERWSLDSLAPRAETEDRSVVASGGPVASLATFAYLLQEVSVYLFSGLAKSGTSWWPDGTAIYYAFQLDEWSGSLAHYALYFPELLRLLSYFVLGSEIVLPLLLLSPWGQGPLRTLSVTLFLAFHASLMLTMKLGMFPAVGLAAALGLFPAWAWRRAPFRKLEAALNKLYGKAGLARWAPPSPSPPGPILTRVSQALLALLIVSSLGWNLIGLHYGEKIPYPIQTLGRFLTVDQNWALFAPDPPQDTGWMVVEGELSDGRVMDLIRFEGEATRVRPSTPADIYRSQREKRFFVVLGNPVYKSFYPPYANFLFRRWEQLHPDLRLEKIRLVWMAQQTRPDYEDRPPQAMVRFEMENPR